MIELFDALRIPRAKLKYIDLSDNSPEISMIHAFRSMIERNINLQYLVISGLHKFNSHAIDSLCDSLILNAGLKLIDVKKTTKEFFNSL